MRATLSLFNTHFWKSVYGPVMAFLFPILFLVILGNILNITYVLPGIISMAGMFIGVLAMPLFVMEMKNSTLLKYVGASPINPLRFTSAVVIFYLLISFGAIINILLFGMALFSKDVFPPTGFNTGLYSGIFSAFGSFSFWVANFIHIAMSLGIGLLIVSLTKTVQRTLTIGLMIAIPSMFLSGMVLPVDVIAASPAMQFVSHITPFRYSTGLLVVSSTPMSQTGDFLQHVSPENLRLIFNDVGNDGTIYISGIATSGGKYEVTNLDQLASIMEAHKAQFGNLNFFYRDNIKDSVLFQQIFENVDLRAMSSTSNNIFALGTPFGVRKVPDMNLIMNFISDYLLSAASNDAIANGADSLLELQQRIGNGDMSWLELFTEQTVMLFGIGDMIVNLLIPIGITATSIFVAIKEFRWSSR